MRAAVAGSSVSQPKSWSSPSSRSSPSPSPSLWAICFLALVISSNVINLTSATSSSPSFQTSNDDDDDSSPSPSPSPPSSLRAEKEAYPNPNMETADKDGDDDDRGRGSSELGASVSDRRTELMVIGSLASAADDDDDDDNVNVGGESGEASSSNSKQPRVDDSDGDDGRPRSEQAESADQDLESSFGTQREGEEQATGTSSRVRRQSFPYFRRPRAGPPTLPSPPPPPPPPPPPFAFHPGGPAAAASFPRPAIAAVPGGVPEEDLLDDPSRRSILRDRSQCYSGNCEFFAMCWATGGLLSGGCGGGFFFSCCVRPGTYIAEHTYNSEPARIQYGPVINDPNCGRSQPYGAQRRIVGGDNAGFGVFPWQAYIRIGKSRCGGSLINRKHVVTAGHCVKRATPSMVQVTLGDYVLGQEIEPLEAQKFGVVDIKVHPKFKYTPQADRYDVAVLTLDRAVEFGPHMAPVCLPEKGEDFLGERAWVAGWGAMQPGSRLRPRTLQAVDVPVINNKECEDWHKSKGITVIIYDEMTCAGWRNGGRDACQGDSGGPLMVHRYGRWYLIGLVSAGYSCAQSKQPGIYHRVSYTADWISAVANKNRAFNRHHEEDDSADSADGSEGGFADDEKEYDYYK